MKNKILFIAVVLLQVYGLQAQTKKAITLSHKQAVSDQIFLKEGDKEQELTVKFLFNEDSNTLTLTLRGAKSLFVFQADTRYCDVFSFRRWLQPEKLPYVALCNTGDRFRVTKAFRKTLGCSRSKHLFSHWFETDGLQPHATPYRLVNDSLVQPFSLTDPQSSTLALTLHDVLLMDEVKHPGSGHLFEIFAGKDLNTQYQIALHRNPCLGKEEDIAAAKGSLDALKRCLALFQKKYASKKVTDATSLKDFREMKGALTEMFPKRDTNSSCPAVRQALGQYNQLVDSLLVVDVTLDTTHASPIVVEEQTLNAKTILANARQVDRLVSRWLVSSDKNEQSDIVEQCRSIISDTRYLIGDSQGKTADERLAIDLFHNAEQYFRKVIIEN